MDKTAEIKARLRRSVTVSKEKTSVFFKTAEGQYGAHDEFIGVTVPAMRTLARDFFDLPLRDLQKLLRSRINEERFFALIILVNQYQKANADQQAVLYRFYFTNLKHVNNWNLVDASAHLILGAHLFKSNKQLLLQLVASKNLWERRIAMVATWYFIRQNELTWTFKLAKRLLQDEEDLIHKATGWMLREAGKKDVTALKQFLKQNAVKMPRTMLRYAIEKFPQKERKSYLLMKA